MSASLVGSALAWLIISLHVSVHGGRFWTWFLGYQGVILLMIVVNRFAELSFWGVTP